MPNRAEFARLHEQATSSPWEWSGVMPGALRSDHLRQNCMTYLKSHTVGDSDIDGAEMIVAELIGNVVRHALGSALFHIDWHAMRPVLLVLDAGPGFTKPPVTTLDDPYAESGRGLALVSALGTCVEWGNRTGGGGFVRATLPLRRSPERKGTQP